MFRNKTGSKASKTKKIYFIKIILDWTIETGKTQGDVIEILKGIDNGAEIIQEGARSVKDGQEVKILKV